MEDDLSKYDFTRFVPAEKEYSNDCEEKENSNDCEENENSNDCDEKENSNDCDEKENSNDCDEKENSNDCEEKDWVITEELVEEQTPDKESSNETSEEKVKNEMELSNKEGETTPTATAGEHTAKNKSVLNIISPEFHQTLCDMFAQRSGLNTTTEAISKNNQGERVGKKFSTPFKTITYYNEYKTGTDRMDQMVQYFRGNNEDPFYRFKMEMQAHKDLLKDLGQRQQLEQRQEHQQQPMQQQQPHRSLYNVLKIQEISKNVNDTFASIDNAFNKEKTMLLLQSEMRNCQNKIAILQSYQSTLQQQMDQLLRN